MISLQREARRAALSILKSNAALTAIVPAARIYSQRVPAMPTWPFIKQGPTQSLPVRASCTRGAIVSFSIHAFAKPRMNGAVEIETAEDYASRIGGAIEAALDSNRADFPGGTIRFRLNEMQLLQDAGEAGSFHYFAVVSARVIA
jgi:hypothetical protein